jgi:DNA-directed RNA polymerase specialized sigma24 family protein
LLRGRWTLEDIDDVEGLIGSVVDRFLGRRGAYLRPDLREDLDGYLLGETWRLYRRFDPSKASTPLSLSTFLTRRLQWAIVDWYRLTFRDSRYASSTTDLSLDEMEIQFEPVVEDEARLLPSLSDTGRGRWNRFGVLHVLGFSYGEIAERAGVSTTDVREELEALGHELRSLGS